MVELAQVVVALEDLAPRRLAGSWDNVGLLLQGTRPVRRIHLCIDLTEAVLAEALAAGADLVVSYHPPLFQGVKRLTEATASGRVVLEAVRAGVHVYSPHTALDAAAGGLNDWLLEAFGEVTDVAPLEPDALEPDVGAGRRATLAAPAELGPLVDAIKAHLALDAVRVAAPADLRRGERRVTRVAVCPGAGGSLFAGVRDVDLLLTGEMRHHDVLARVGEGVAVVLTDHTNTERGYLPRLADRLESALTGVEVRVSAVDADPLTIR